LISLLPLNNVLAQFFILQAKNHFAPLYSTFSHYMPKKVKVKAKKGIKFTKNIQKLNNLQSFGKNPKNSKNISPDKTNC